MYLIDTRDGVLHGVLNSDDVHLRLVQTLQHRVERRTLSAPRGARHEKNTVGNVQQLFDEFLVVKLETDTVQTNHSIALVENADDDLFPVDGGKRGNTKIDPMFQDLDNDPPILGTPFFGNVHARHDLDPRHHRRMQSPGIFECVEESTVHAKAHPARPFMRFEMQIRGTFSHGLLQHVVHQLDNRCFLRPDSIHPGGELRFDNTLRGHDLDTRIGEGLLHYVRRIQGTADLRRRRKVHLHFHAREHAQFIQGEDVQGVTDGNRKEIGTGNRHGENFEATGYLLGNQAERFRHGFEARKRNQGFFQLLRQSPCKMALRHPSVLDENFSKATVCQPLFLQRSLQLGFRNGARLDKKIPESDFLHGHACPLYFHSPIVQKKDPLGAYHSSGQSLRVNMSLGTRGFSTKHETASELQPLIRCSPRTSS